MKASVVVSFGAVVGVAALSAAAFMGTSDAAAAVVKQGTESATVYQGKPIIAAEERIRPEIENRGAEDAYFLAKIAMAEAEGEDTEGKALVMLVVLNRVKADGFPDSVEDVIYQPRQFSPVSNGRFDRVEPDADCWRALSMIDVDGWDESMGATYFESESESTWHEENLSFLFRHGNYYFYTDKETGE